MTPMEQSTRRGLSKSFCERCGFQPENRSQAIAHASECGSIVVPSPDKMPRAYIAWRIQPHPETREQDGAEIHETLGVYASDEGAQRRLKDEHRARLLEAATDDGYKSVEAYRASENFYDPDWNATYGVTCYEVLP